MTALVTDIPPLGYGTYPLMGAEACEATLLAIEVGYRHIDTAQWYGNETAIGEAVRRSGVTPSEIFVATKVHPDNLSPARFLPSVEESLARLGGDRVDLLLIHWPPPDPALFEPALEQLVAARDEGLARRIGVSNFAAGQMARARRAIGPALACNQVEFHPYLDQSRLLAASRETGVALSAYSSLARGKVLADPAIVAIADRMGRSASAVVLRWILQQGVLAMCQTRRRENAIRNLEALAFDLSVADMAAISALSAANVRIVDLPALAPDWDRD
ncbi:MAG TPA: aldo/keto reductase [Methylomirabilota bacterium]|nr:aldo/keto reductase [Methylomirabilota bacterium]